MNHIDSKTIHAAAEAAASNEYQQLEQFQADSRTVDAVVRNLEVLGEAANALPAAIQATAPAVDWRGLVGLRNRLIHEYFGVSLSTVWVIATQIGRAHV